MKVIAIAKPERHLKPHPENYLQCLQEAKQYIQMMKNNGKIIYCYYMLGSSKQSMSWVVEADSPNDMWTILSNMPKIDGTPWHWETHPLVECEWIIEQRMIELMKNQHEENDS